MGQRIDFPQNPSECCWAALDFLPAKLILIDLQASRTARELISVYCNKFGASTLAVISYASHRKLIHTAMNDDTIKGQ